jgi:hypothetical protein
MLRLVPVLVADAIGCDIPRNPGVQRAERVEGVGPGAAAVAQARHHEQPSAPLQVGDARLPAAPVRYRTRSTDGA